MGFEIKKIQNITPETQHNPTKKEE